MSRADQYNVTASLDGTSLGTFDKLSGGEIDSEEFKYRPGGMAPQVSLGGSKMVSNVTISRLFIQARDLPLVPTLIARVGKGDVVITKQALDVDGNPFGKPLVYQGKLKTFTPPDHDSESNDAALFTLEVSSAGTVIS